MPSKYPDRLHVPVQALLAEDESMPQDQVLIAGALGSTVTVNNITVEKGDLSGYVEAINRDPKGTHARVTDAMAEAAVQGLFALDARAHEVDLDETIVEKIEAPIQTCYIAGPMTGIPEYNFPAFNEAEEALVGMGYTVVNPAVRGVQKGWVWKDYLASDLQLLLHCGSVCLLPGWEKSRGARLEAFVGSRLGKRIFYYEDLQEIDPVEIGEIVASHLERVVAPDPAERPLEPVEVEARRLVDISDGKVGERQSSYGHPLDDFTGTAKMWTGLILGKLRPGVEISAEEVAMMMVALKLRRETHQRKRDNKVDGIGYLLCLDLLEKERERRLLVKEPIG